LLSRLPTSSTPRSPRFETAVEADVDVRGAWEFRTDGSTHDWEVNVTELTKRSDEDG